MNFFFWSFPLVLMPEFHLLPIYIIENFVTCNKFVLQLEILNISKKEPQPLQAYQTNVVKHISFLRYEVMEEEGKLH